MSRAHAANACVQSDSIKGLAQSIAKPAYTRLLTAEPALRRAVPTLIIAFLVTICLGAFVQVIDQTRQKRGAMKRDIAALADNVRRHWQAHGRGEVVVMSFHGLPKRGADRYERECRATAALLARALDLAEFKVTLQSRFGYADWLAWFWYTVLLNMAGGLLVVTFLRLLRSKKLIQEERAAVAAEE